MGGSERRKFARIKLEKVIRVCFRDKEHFVNQTIGDISMGGMLLKTRAAVPVGTILHFEFVISEDLPNIIGRGEVVRISFDSKGVQEGLGIRFMELDSRSKELLARIISENSRKERKLP